LALLLFLLQSAPLLPLPAAQDAESDQTLGEDVAALLAEVVESQGPDRAPLLYRLRHLGADALPATRAARDAAGDSTLRSDLDDAVHWQLASKVDPALRAAIDSQLTFDGQFARLAAEGDEVIDALLAAVSDEVRSIDIRVYAVRVLADAVTHLSAEKETLPRIRELHADVLLPPGLREQLGVLLAILGDTRGLDHDLKRLEKLAQGNDPRRVILSNQELANLNYRIRNYKRAVECYDRILELYEEIYAARKASGPEEVVAQLRSELALHYYNAACSNALFGDLERTRDLLKKAVEHHGDHFQNIEKDGDLKRLTEDPGYPEFRRELEKLFDGVSL